MEIYTYIYRQTPYLFQFYPFINKIKVYKYKDIYSN